MKKVYEKPIVEVMDARVEIGFAGSGSDAPQGKGSDQWNVPAEGYQFN